MATLQERVVNIVTSPGTEWPVIAGETTDVGKLYKEYVMPLSAITPIAQFVGWSLVSSVLSFGSYYQRTITGGFTWMVVNYILGLATVYVCAVVIEFLGPKFKSSGSRIDALKLVAYASTPAWIAGVLYVIPFLGVLVLLAILYSIYLFYLGLPHLMKTPADQVVGYMVVSALVVIVLYVVLGAITTLLVFGGGPLSVY